MAIRFSLLLLTLLLTTTTTLTSAAETPSPSSPPSKPKTPPHIPPPPPPNNPPPSQHTPPSPPPKIQGDQLNNILDALIGAGDFAGWANILSSADPSALPLSATLFIPNNAAISNLPSSAVKTNIDSFLIPYHIVLQRLTFSDLQKYPIGTRLPTLLPSKFIVITNNSQLNFTINDSPITHPDIFVTGTFSVHGIKNVLSYSPIPSPPGNTTSTAPGYNSKPKNREPGVPKEIGPRSAAICIEFFRIVWVFCVVFCILGFML